MTTCWLVSVVVSTIRWLFVTVGIVAIGWLVSVVVSTIRWLFVTIGIVAIGWLFVTVGVITVSAIGFRMLFVTVVFRLVFIFLWFVAVRFFPILILGFVFVPFHWRFLIIFRRWWFLPTFV